MAESKQHKKTTAEPESSSILINDDHPVQILIYNEQLKKFELNRTELEKIFCNGDVKDANIAIVSIVGAFRQGKSFILGFFLRYLYETYIHNRENWLGSEETDLSGFLWRGGYERHTTGIWIWSKVFTKVLPNGKKIGVVLMDTQGTFDNKSTTEENVMIFSLSILLSSMKIYNLFNNIKEIDLHHLQLFTEYGKLALGQGDEKAFQMLLFLIRDWNHPYQVPYGFQGGRHVLKETLEVANDQAAELSSVRNHLTSCYEKLDCFLMPYPGRVATISPNFSGQLKDIDKDFIDMLRELVPALLAPQNVLIKKINGFNVKGKDCITFIKSYWKIFNSGILPTAQTILSATSEANNSIAKEEASELYYRKMGFEIDDKPILSFNEIMLLHEDIAQQSLELFRSKAVMGDEQLKSNYSNKLKDEIQRYLLLYLAKNEGKKAKDMEEIIHNLKDQISTYESESKEQNSAIANLKDNLDDMQKKTELINVNYAHLKDELKQVKRDRDTDVKRISTELENQKKSNDSQKKTLLSEMNKMKSEHEKEILRTKLEATIKENEYKQKMLEDELERTKTHYDNEIKRIKDELATEMKPTFGKLVGSAIDSVIDFFSF